ncbi:hypothetical protein BLOT_014110 [Blomia tropicalis]|nr:hypothetical protein BLOT_014110 [Blomia tropicalis]
MFHLIDDILVEYWNIHYSQLRRVCTPTAQHKILCKSNETMPPVQRIHHHSTSVIKWLQTTLITIVIIWNHVSVLAQSSSNSEINVQPNTFYESEQHCKGEWKYPESCANFSCDYKASWEYRDDDDQIIFTISTKNRNKWTGIAFSNDQAMPETDAILGLVEESGRFFLMDSWLQAYEAPPLDPVQNLYNQTAWRENGITTLKFSRPRQTGDSRDYQFSDTNCPYFIFPVMGGVFNAVNKRIRKHESTPVISDRPICIRSCRAPTTTTSTTSTSTTSTTTPTIGPTTMPTMGTNDHETSSDETNHDGTNGMSGDEGTKIYRLELKLYNFLTPKARQVNSEEYQDLLSSFEESLYQEIKPQFDRIRRVEVNELINDGSHTANKNVVGNGNVLAIIDLTIGQKNKEDRDDSKALTVALSQVIQDRQIAKFNVDNKYLVIVKKDSKLSTWIANTFGSFSHFTEDEQKWIVIGAGISALVLLAIIQALCMFCRCRRSRTDELDDYTNEKDNVDKQWKEYSHDQYGNGTMYNGGGYGNGSSHPDEYMGYGNGKSNSLHKNYRHHHSMEQRAYHQQHHHQIAPDTYHTYGYGHPSLDRRQHDQHHQFHSSRRSQNGMGGGGHPYELNERMMHHQQGASGSGKSHHFGPSNSHQQPDFYFMPHQRKYSNDVVRVFVDYDAN